MSDVQQQNADASTPKVSVIVPVYNVQDYLGRCVESLIAQTLADIEILLIDDGATDNSGALCDEWAKRDERIRVFHKPNGGLSDARNYGVREARAPYVGFVDSDDYVSPEMYQVLYDNLMADGSDVSVCGAYSVYESHTVASERDDRYCETGIEALRETLIGDKLRVWAWLKLYRRQIMLEAPMPVGRTYEDAFVLADVFTRAQRVSVDLRPQYYYWHHEGTITSKPFSHKTMDIVDAYEHTYDVVMQRCPELQEEAAFRLYWSRFEVLDKMLQSAKPGTYPEQKAVVAYLRAHAKDIQACPYVGRGRKLAMRALSLSVGLYNQFSKANARKYKVKES